MFTITAFEILLFECMSVLSTAKQFIGSERVKISVKNQKNYSAFVEISSKLIDLQN